MNNRGHAELNRGRYDKTNKSVWNSKDGAIVIRMGTATRLSTFNSYNFLAAKRIDCVIHTDWICKMLTDFFSFMAFVLLPLKHA